MKAKTIALVAVVPLILMTACGKPQKEEVPKVVKAPEQFRVKFETTKGDFVVDVTRAWAPRGVDRLYELLTQHYFDGCKFFRVVPRFVVQFGLNGDPAISQHWSEMTIPDDPVKVHNTKGTLSYAKAGPATRTTQIFINLQDNPGLDGMGFSPFGKISSGMEVVESFFKGYGDGPPQGVGPEQARIRSEGNPYLERYFPRLDGIKTATVVPVEGDAQ